MGLIASRSAAVSVCLLIASAISMVVTLAESPNMPQPKLPDVPKGLWPEREPAITSGAWRDDCSIYQLPNRPLEDRTQLRNGDRVTHWNGTAIASKRQLADSFHAGFKGDKIKLTVERNVGSKEEPKLESFELEITLRGNSDLYGEMARGGALFDNRTLAASAFIDMTLHNAVSEAIDTPEALSDMRTCFEHMTGNAHGYWVMPDVKWLLNEPFGQEQWARNATQNTAGNVQQALETMIGLTGSEDLTPGRGIVLDGLDHQPFLTSLHNELRSINNSHSTHVVGDSIVQLPDDLYAQGLDTLFAPIWSGHPDWQEFSTLIQRSKLHNARATRELMQKAQALMSQLLPGGIGMKFLQDYRASGRFPSGYNDRIVILGPGNDTYTGAPQILIDLGGNDTYRLSTPRDAHGHPHSQVIIDLSGDDTYIAERGGLASGSFSFSALIDMAGDDVYRCKENGLGFGLFGVGILYDHAGHDRYEGDTFTMGVAFNGVGLLIDKAGNDRYNGASFSCGVGLGGGLGAIVDEDGDDIYACTGKVDSGYGDEGEYTAFGLGVGFGFRGLTAGGIGIVFDKQGKDIYRAGQFGLGCGYWWGAGIVHDVEGNDIYECSRYGLGSGAHYGVGIVLDDAGDDTYTAIRRSAVAEMGSTWDLSVGTLIDSAGDDVYRGRGYCLGGAAQNSYGIFWDKLGDDVYIAQGKDQSAGYIGGDDYGAGRGADNLAVFLDSGGKDTYTMEGRANDTTKVVKKYGVFIDRDEKEKEE